MAIPVKRRHHIIYKYYWHSLVTLFIIVLPVVFFIFFSKATNIKLHILSSDIGVSLLRMAFAYAISIIVGWSLAILFYRGKVSIIALPVFDVLQSVPMFAALPLAVLYFGSTSAVVVFFVVFSNILWPVFFSVISSLKLIKNEYQEAVTIYNLSGWQKIRYFLFPASVPGLITGSIVGLGDAWEGIIATEIIVGMRSGLGPFFQGFSNNPTITLFGILGVLMVIFAINKIFLLPLLEKSHSLVEE